MLLHKCDWIQHKKFNIDRQILISAHLLLASARIDLVEYISLDIDMQKLNLGAFVAGPCTYLIWSNAFVAGSCTHLIWSNAFAMI